MCKFAVRHLYGCKKILDVFSTQIKDSGETVLPKFHSSTSDLVFYFHLSHFHLHQNDSATYMRSLFF